MSGREVGPITRSVSKNMDTEEEERRSNHGSGLDSNTSSSGNASSQDSSWSHGTNTVAELTTETASSDATNISNPSNSELGNSNTGIGARGNPVFNDNGNDVGASHLSASLEGAASLRTQAVDANLEGSASLRDKAADEANTGGMATSRREAIGANLEGSASLRHKAADEANLGGTEPSRQQTVGIDRLGAYNNHVTTNNAVVAEQLDLGSDTGDLGTTRRANRAGAAVGTDPPHSGLGNLERNRLSFGTGVVTLDEQFRADDERIARLRAETELRESQLRQARAATSYAAARYELLMAERRNAIPRTPSPNVISPSNATNNLNVPSTLPQRVQPARNISPSRDSHIRNDNDVRNHNTNYGSSSPAGEISALRDAIVQAISMTRTDSHSSPQPQHNTSNKYIGDLPFFDGNPSDWISFKKVYLDTESSFSDIANMGRLRKAVKGQARDSVRALLHTCSNPYEVVDALDRAYGKPDVIILSEIQNVKKMARMSEDGRNISEFSNRVCNIVSSITALNKPQYLYAPELVSRIVEKLNNIVKFEWYRYKSGHENVPELLAISKFLKDLSINFNSMFAYEQAKKTHTRTRQVNNVNSRRNRKHRDSSESSWDEGGHSDFYEDNTVPSRDSRALEIRRNHRDTDYDSYSEAESEQHFVAATNKRTNRNRYAKNGNDRKFRPQSNRDNNFNNKKENSNHIKCVICAGNHSIASCADFLKQNVNDRWETVRKFRLCFKCLSDSHRSASSRCRYRPCAKGGCEAAHHSSLHGRNNLEQREKVAATKEHVSSVNHTNQSQAYLKIIPVELSGSKGSISTFALMDEGATLSLIQKDIANEIEEPGKRETLSFEGVGGHEVVDHDSSRVKLSIRGLASSDSHDITAHTVDKLNLAPQKVDRSIVRECAHLRHLEDELCYESAQPTVLIGQDSWHLIVSRQIREGGKRLPCASLTQLGWVLHGMNEKPRRLLGSVNHIKPTHDSIDPALALIREHFSIESLGIEPRKQVNDPEDRAVKILEKTCKRIPGQDRFEAGLLWKTDEETLPENRAHALKRLYSLEKRLDSDQALKIEYNKQMNDFLDQGFAEKIDTNPDSPRVFYLPHFPVFHKKKKKMRLVHDAACRTSGKALNDAILSGPDLIQSLYGVLIRFREGNIGVISDIKQMFLQIKIKEEDRDSLRFLWRGDDRQSPPQTYRMTSLIFGSAASPATAIYVKNKNANDYRDSYPEVAKLTEKNFYVDDFLGAFDTIEHAQRTISDMDNVFKKASFKLCGWASNKPTVLRNVQDKSTETTTTLGKSDQERTLGLLWNHQKDSLGFNLNLQNTPPDVVKGLSTPTKRQVTSAVFSVFDPTGLATPVTILGKMLIQDLWRASCEWDDPIPDHLNKAWREWIGSLDLLQDLAVPRHIPRSQGPIYLHVFTDASEKAYAAAVYIVVIDSKGNKSSYLVSSKARVTPLKCISIPRLELQATVLGCRLADSVKKETNYEIYQTHYWTDSRTVLAWIHSDPRTFKPFVAHRLAELETYTRPSDWHWVSTHENVADLATRGVKSDFDINHRWFSGPQFILEAPDKWPKIKSTAQVTTSTGEERNVVNTVSAPDYTQGTNSYLPDPTRFSSYKRLQRALGRLLLAVEIFIRKRAKNAYNNDLESRHLLIAEHLLLQQCQEECFNEDITRLRNNNNVPKSSKLYRLAVKLTKDGLLTLDGRYKINSATNQRQPIILDIKNHTTRLIVHHYHEQFNHGNHHTVINELQQKYHIIGLRSYLRNIHTRCQWCKIKKAKPVKHQQGDLPQERLLHHQPAFTATATDYFGPIKVAIGRRVEKRWGALYTCLTTRAVHVEIANSLSASSMIQTLRRMMARRGTPTIIYSDNGTNYIGAEREIKEALDSAELKDFFINKRIIWKKIPPGAPSMGGAWEVMVKGIKNALYSTLRDKIPSEDTLHTLLLEAEHIVNSRPLTPINANLAEEQLTPNHFLIQRSNGMTPFGTFSDKKPLKNTWQEVQSLAERFWKKWLIEYKPTLLPRKRTTDQPNLKPNDVVLIVDSTLPRGTWPRGLIEKVYPGPDGKGLPSWSRGLEAAEAARARLVRWACGETPPEEPPRKKMPHALRKRWPLCPCLQNDEPPEITYCVVGGEGGLALQAVTPTHPMPPQDELDAKFAELVEELDLTAVNKAAMMELPAAKKWQIYCSRRPPPGTVMPMGTAPQVEEYIKALNEIADAFASSEGVAPESCALLDGLKTALRTRAHSFVLRFVKQGGLGALLDALQRAPRDDAINRHNLIAAIKALMNNSTGRAHVLAHPTSIDLIAQSLDTENAKTKVAALEILGAVCLVPGGHKKVLEAMVHYQKYAAERARFQSVINELDRSTGAYRDDLGLKTAIMSFVNAVLNYGAGEDSLEFRLHLRYEFLMLGIQPVIEKLRKYENETLDRHIDFFEMIRNEDEKELARRFDKQHVDTKSAGGMFELLRRKLSHTAAYPHLLSMLEHMLLLPLEYNPHTQHWLLLDRVVQQVILQQPNAGSRSTSSQDTDRDMCSDINKVYDPDVAPLEINVTEIVHLLAKEEELVAARTKAENLEKENVDLATELAKKEKQVDQQSQEREELEGVVARLKERLERETAAHMESAERARHSAMRSTQLEQQLNQERSERARFEKLVSEGSIPDDAKVSNLKSAVIETCSIPPPPPPPSLCPPPPPAPMPPSGPMPPPVPLAPLAPMTPKPKKNVPTPGNPLKSFNWSKLPDTKLHGTIWQELDDTKLYNAMDLNTIDKMFCAYQKNGVQNEGSVEDLRQLGSKPRTKILSVIDGRRAQNCTILLSKLKMSDEEICRAILRMDSGEQLPIDMVEQLAKFTPSAEEAALLEEHQDELDNMARADRFLYEISKIPHYSQRVRTLLFKKKFAAAGAEACARASTVLRAARDMTRSRRLRALLEVVLALGNYMNRGARGNASGFRLSSLNKLADTKSSVTRNTTLLHYLVELLETQFKDILLLEEDLPHVRAAAKICVEQLEKDVGALRTGLREVQRELEYHASLPAAAPNDAFVPVMREFHAHAVCSFTQLEDLFQDMKSRLEACAHAFGEEASASPEQLFGALDTFLAQLVDARAECDAQRRRRGEEERRTRHDQELKKRTMERKQASSLLSSVGKSLGKANGDCNGHGSDSSRDSTLTNGQKGEFDDLISALRTGDVFGDDVAKFKRSRKTSKAQKGRDSPPRGVCREDSRERSKN